MILTRQDLSDEENLRRCRHEFVTADDTLGSSRPFKLAEWALDWGEAALHALENPSPDCDEDDLKSVEEDLAEERAQTSRLETAMRKAVDALEDLAYPDGEDDPSPNAEKLEPILAILETEL